MANEKLIELLNKSLEMEYCDIFLYARHADALEEKETAENFEKLGRMEVRHADSLAIQIQALGGKPNWEITPLDAKGSKDEMLTYHLEQEERAIRGYDDLIELADKEGQDQLKLILKGIKSEEESHAEITKSLLGKRK